MTPEQRAEWAERLIELCKAQEAENARLRDLLDEIHRGDAQTPDRPKRYDEQTVEEGKCR